MAAGSASRANQLSLLKRLWGTSISMPYYEASKLLALCKKDTKFGSEGRYVNVSLSPTKGGSASFVDALEMQGSTDETRFFVTPRKEYQVFAVQGDLIATANGNANSVIEAYKHSANRARQAHARAMSRRIWGNGGGSAFQLHATTTLASTTLLLRSDADEASLEAGMQYEFASDDGSAASPAGRRATVPGTPDRLTIVSVNRNASPRSAVMSGLLNTVNGITVNDFGFRRGDYAQAIAGNRGWHPTTTPVGGDSFFGVDRSTVDVQRACGFQFAGGGKAKEEVLVDASAQAQIKGLKTPKVFANPLDVAGLIKELGSKVTVDMKSTDGKVGFKGVRVNLATGEADVVAEVDVPQGFFWMQDPDSFTLRTAGDCPRSLHWGNGDMELVHDDDAVRHRLGCYGNTTDDEPGLALIGSW